MTSGIEQYMHAADEKPASKMGAFLRAAELGEDRKKRPFPPKWERANVLYFRAVYWLLRKLTKHSHPFDYARGIAGIVASLADGEDFTKQLDYHILAPSDFISITDSLIALNDQLDREEVLRNIAAFGQLRSATIRELCMHKRDGLTKFAKPELHLAAHAMAVSALATMMKQPASFFGGKNDTPNVNIVKNGLRDLTIYMESILAVRL